MLKLVILHDTRELSNLKCAASSVQCYLFEGMRKVVVYVTENLKLPKHCQVFVWKSCQLYKCSSVG